MPRSRLPAPWRSGTATASMSGPTARASISCAPICPWFSNCRPRTSRSSIWRAQAAMDTTRPKTLCSTPFCLPKPPMAGPCGYNGHVQARCRTLRLGPLWQSRSLPISTPRAKFSTGAIRSGATAMWPDRDAPHYRRCWRDSSRRIRFHGRSRPILRRPMAAAATATPYRSMISRPGISKAIA